MNKASPDKPTVVIHITEDGLIQALTDGDVRVIFVDENTPSDRLYMADPQPIPKGLLDGPMGFYGDDTGKDDETRLWLKGGKYDA